MTGTEKAILMGTSFLLNRFHQNRREGSMEGGLLGEKKGNGTQEYLQQFSEGEARRFLDNAPFNADRQANRSHMTWWTDLNKVKTFQGKMAAAQTNMGSAQAAAQAQTQRIQKNPSSPSLVNMKNQLRNLEAQYKYAKLDYDQALRERDRLIAEAVKYMRQERKDRETEIRLIILGIDNAKNILKKRETRGITGTSKYLPTQVFEKVEARKAKLETQIIPELDALMMKYSTSSLPLSGLPNRLGRKEIFR